MLADTLTKTKRLWRFHFIALPSMLVALLPKCPMCLAALFGSIGVGTGIKASWLLPLILSVLCLSLFALSFHARSRRGYGPFWMGFAAATMVILGKFQLDNDPFIYCGMALLVAASIWNAWPKRQRVEPPCQC